MDTQSNSGQSAETLLQHFTEAQELFQQLDTGTLSARSPEFKELITKTIRGFQTCAVLIAQNNFFSPNEEVEEMKTSTIKYLAVPYYLGDLYQRYPSDPKAPEERLGHLQRAKDYLERFLNSLVTHKIVAEQAQTEESSLIPEESRALKIQRYKREQLLKNQLSELVKQRMESPQLLEDEDKAEDSEFERKTGLLLLETNSLKAIESLNSIKQEQDVLNHMHKLIQEKGFLPPPPEPTRHPPMEPIVIQDRRRVEVENAFRPGWNLPTVSIEQANLIDYEEALTREQRQDRNQARDKLVKEYGDDQGNDVEDIYKQREFDAFKDDHPRGSGNTGTKGYKY